MKCPYCRHPDNKVVDKRGTPDESATRRRRECLKCGKRFSTYERVEVVELIVVKKDGARVDFDKNKLFTGIKKACEKRPIPREKLEEVANSVEAELLAKKKKEVTSRDIGERVMKKLKKLDKVAYIRFASVYMDFQDPDSFKQEINNLNR